MRSFALTIEGAEYQIEVSEQALTVNGRPFVVDVREGIVTVDGIEYGVELGENTAWVDGFPYPYVFRDGHESSSPRQRAPSQPVDAGSTASRVAHDGRSVISAMPGRVLRLVVQEGDRVQAGDVVCILEAMKMENELHAECDGTVSRVLVKPGQSVEAGEPLVIVV